MPARPSGEEGVSCWRVVLGKLGLLTLTGMADAWGQRSKVEREAKPGKTR